MVENMPGRAQELDPGLSIASEALLAVAGPPRLVSNRGPIQFRLGPGGTLKPERGPGGVVTALSSILEREPVLVASPMTEGDRMVEGETPLALGESRFRARFVNGVSRETYQLYYNEFANPLLWFIQHGMSDILGSSFTPDRIMRAWKEGYVPVNRQFAETVLESLKKLEELPIIMLQDYHLYLVPAFLRERAPQDRKIAITHFTHIPWPQPKDWEGLPQEIRMGLLRGLTAADIAGFQTNSYRRNFLETCRKFLPNARVNFVDETVEVDGHECHTAVYPISIDVGKLQRLARSQEVAAYREEIAKETGEMTIVRVDRIDPTKNIVRGFQAFDHLLRRYPEHQGRVHFLAFLVPSRSDIPEYQEYARQVRTEVDIINQKYSWGPVRLFVGDNYARAIAGMQLYDVLLVNPVLDGMNLVSKEGPIVNQKDGVVVLSRGAGSAEQLNEGVVMVDPLDIAGTASALDEALKMPPDSRARRSIALQRVVREGNIYRWWDEQLRDILRAVEGI